MARHAIPNVFALRCAGCRQSGSSLCRRCRFALASSPAVSFGPIRAAMSFDGAVRSAILGLKFANQRAVARHLAALLVRRLGLDRGSAAFDIVTWAPTSRQRLSRRGYDQAELLARATARRLGVPCRRLLYRTHGAPQAGRGRAERLAGPKFRVRQARPGVRVLVVDDVVTTGSTLRAAEAALRAAGVTEVTLVAVAATPGRGVRPLSPWTRTHVDFERHLRCAS
jgi:competence protein ComFC